MTWASIVRQNTKQNSAIDDRTHSRTAHVCERTASYLHYVPSCDFRSFAAAAVICSAADDRFVHRGSLGMGACASTQAASDPATAQRPSVSERALQRPLPSETPGATTLAHAVATQEPSGAVPAHSTANRGPDHIASAPTSGADVTAAGKTAVVPPAAVSHTPQAPPPVPSAAAGGPELAQIFSAPDATGNGNAAAPEPAASDGEPEAAAPADPQATALAAVLAGGAYRSNESGPARPACQQERLQTVADIRDSLKQAHDPAIGARQPPSSSKLLLM